MKKIILFLTILIIPLTQAIQFSPSNFDLELEKNEIVCKKIHFALESYTTLSDVWAENPNQEWKISNFQTTSEEHEIKISYPAEINFGEKEIEFCISGSQAGEHKGALVFRQEEIGNSIIQFAVWIKLSILEDEEETPQQNQKITSRKRKKSNHKTDISEQISNSPEIEKLNYPSSQKSITLQNPKEKKFPTKTIFYLVPTILATIFLITILIKKKTYNSKETY